MKEGRNVKGGQGRSRMKRGGKKKGRKAGNIKKFHLGVKEERKGGRKEGRKEGR